MCLLVDPTPHSWQFSETNQFSKWIESLHDWLFLQWSLGHRSRQVWSWRWTRPASYCWQSHPGICSNLENSVSEHFWNENFNGASHWKYSHAGGIFLLSHGIIIIIIYYWLWDFLECDPGICSGHPSLGRDDSGLFEPLVGLAELDGAPVRRLVSELCERNKFALQHCGICNDFSS